MVLFNVFIFTYKTPSGVYCPNRVSTKTLPLMPNAFKLSGQITQASNEFDGIQSPTNQINVCVILVYIIFI